jgi:hypothetical protein
MPVKITQITKYESKKYRNGVDEYKFCVDDVINKHEILLNQ